jgi:hypothetical protein
MEPKRLSISYVAALVVAAGIASSGGCILQPTSILIDQTFLIFINPRVRTDQLIEFQGRRMKNPTVKTPSQPMSLEG